MKPKKAEGLVHKPFYKGGAFVKSSAQLEVSICGQHKSTATAKGSSPVFSETLEFMLGEQLAAGSLAPALLGVYNMPVAASRAGIPTCRWLNQQTSHHIRPKEYSFFAQWELLLLAMHPTPIYRLVVGAQKRDTLWICWLVVAYVTSAQPTTNRQAVDPWRPCRRAGHRQG